MEYEKAIDVLVQATANVPLVRRDHLLVEEALRVLGGLVRRLGKPEAEKSPAPGPASEP